jgi:hypothetical protein
MLAEKAGTLDLKNVNKNNIGATKKGARKARLANTPARDSANNQPQQGFVAFSKFFESRDHIESDGPTYCCARRLDVIDITLRSFRLQESFKDWKVSSKASLLDHRYTLVHFIGLCMSKPDQESQGYQLELLSRGNEEQSGEGPRN